jgi:hypothetical protein
MTNLSRAIFVVVVILLIGLGLKISVWLTGKSPADNILANQQKASVSTTVNQTPQRSTTTVPSQSQ